ncbi:MAG: hypothetical protein OEZ65_14645 [Gemmatimonadota bacterium]|nr:hypothetical protein [Gemmatimonadota bacterium]
MTDLFWLLIVAPLVGYGVLEWIRLLFSDDRTLVRKYLKEEPVTMIAAMTILGAGLTWVIVGFVEFLWGRGG